MAGRRYCFDADVLIRQLRNAHRHDKVTDQLAQFGRSVRPACSAIAMSEVLQGVRSGEDEQTALLFAGLDVLPIDRDVAERGAAIVREERGRGRTVHLADALIAATYIAHDLVLVTMNERDFNGIDGLTIEVLP